MAAIPRNSIGTPAPAFCKSATTSAPATINAALRTLTAATMRARRSGGAQAWIAAKDGTIISPPATASMPRSITACQAIGRAKKADAARAVVVSTGGRRTSANPRSNAKRPISSAPTAVGNKIIRPAENQEARPEPTAMATAKTARKTVTTVSAPSSVRMTRGGSSDSTTAPTSQKMLVTTAQRQSRVSDHALALLILFKIGDQTGEALVTLAGGGFKKDRQEVLKGAGRYGPGDPHRGAETDRGDAEEQYREPRPDLL